MRRVVPALRAGVVIFQVRIMSEIWEAVDGEPTEREPRDLIAIRDALRLMDTRLSTLKLQASYDRQARTSCYESGLVVTGDLVRWVAAQRGREPAGEHGNSTGDRPVPFSANDSHRLLTASQSKYAHQSKFTCGLLTKMKTVSASPSEVSMSSATV